MDKKKISILGTEYTVFEEKERDNKIFKDCDGYCDTSIKEIHICIEDEDEKDINSLQNQEYYKLRVLRHEIIHAFLYESGLSDICKNEKIVEYFAIQLPKINKVIEEFK